ncbi:hypothetical protein [Streptomyces sp. NPDC017890]|uniref:hypothetical protein n=1 Tax=Streptomyces sp. NPDC017890 TaxID=3365015 RepID=UPI0037949DB7
MSTVPPSERPDDEPSSSVSDEQLESFLREAAGSGGVPAPKEPSARARMVTQRLREQDGTAQRAAGRGRWPRRKRKAQGPPSDTPPGWRTGPAAQGMDGGRTRRRRLRAAVGVAIAVGLVVVAVRPSLVLDRIPEWEAGGAAPSSPAPLPGETALPTGAPGRADLLDVPTRDDPFRGSPALRWGDGAAAIELPDAEAVGGMSKADVELALRRTKEFLVASNLDPAVLRGERPAAAIGVLDPTNSVMRSRVERALTAPSRDDNPLTLFSRFDPAEARVLGDVVKVRGHMTFAAGEPGQVDVHADYTFVYPLVRAGADDGPVERTTVRRDITLTLSDPRKWQVEQGTLNLKTYEVRTYNDECGVYDGYLHPAFPHTAATGAPGTGPAADPYDRSQAMGQESASDEEECGTVTRT